MIKRMTLAALLMTSAPAFAQDDTFSLHCAAEWPASEGGPLVVSGVTGERIGLYERPLSGHEVRIEFRQLGRATVVTSLEHGTILLALEHDTMEGWVPYEPGSDIPAKCRLERP